MRLSFWKEDAVVILFGMPRHVNAAHYSQGNESDLVGQVSRMFNKTYKPQPATAITKTKEQKTAKKHTEYQA
jgi:hypothetical protein